MGFPLFGRFGVAGALLLALQAGVLAGPVPLPRHRPAAPSGLNPALGKAMLNRVNQQRHPPKWTRVVLNDWERRQ